MNKKQNIKAPGHSPECEGEPYYYDGALGYEAMKCDVCGYELDLNAEANARATAERLAAKAQHSPLPTWADQARNAIRQGQDLNEFILHCHPDSRKEARKAYMRLIVRSVNNAEKLAEALRKLKYADDHGLDLTPSIDGALAALAQWEKAQ